MTHINNHPHAFIKDGVVLEVLLFEDHDSTLLNQVAEHLGATKFVSCCEVGILSKGFLEINSKFYPPKPYSSWIPDETLNSWIAPVEYPNDENDYIWDEDSVSWILISLPSQLHSLNGG